MDPKCFFCDVGKDQKSCLDDRLCENDDFLALLDKAPVTPGHVLVFPKRHVVSFFGLGAKSMSKMYEFMITAQEAIAKAHKPDGYTIGVNDGKAAGRSVDHLHVHLIPRYHGDVKDPSGGVRNVIPDAIPPAKQPEEYRS